MAVAAVCEFNPFHNGHKYFLETARSLAGGPVLAVMSGSVTQRGEFAVADKFFRAEAALKNGADLVAELPAVYAAANAERFARGGVRAAAAFGCVTHLAFGCETDDLGLLCAAADAVDDERVQKITAELMRQGDYYPRAFSSAVGRVLGESAGRVLCSPNNILAVEYIRALRGTGITPLPVLRAGAAHDGDTPSGSFASASYIRRLLRSGQPVDKYMPCVPHEVADPKNLERAMLFLLRRMTPRDLAQLPEVGEGLENRLADAVKKHNSIEEIITAVKTKRYTHARIRRILLCAALGITEELQARHAGYVRVLGFSRDGAEMLKTCRCEAVTSVARAMQNDEIRVFLEKDVLATDLCALAFDRIKPCSSDYLTKIIKTF